jgi:hypothetical protein
MATKKRSKSKNGRTEQAATPTAGALSDRPIDGCAHRPQHGCRRRNVGISATLLIGGPALLVTGQREQVYRGPLILSLQVKDRI